MTVPARPAGFDCTALDERGTVLGTEAKETVVLAP